ncbi:MAG TPA: hypothetical protein VLQ91_03980 [Draconibacterium sp.]|nr:hypothetical protein [Draconibacterium sp.]
MSIKPVTFCIALLFVFFSCTKSDKFPVKKSEKAASDNVFLNQSIFPVTASVLYDSVQKIDFGKELNELLGYKQFYENRNEQFELVKLENLWNNLKVETKNFNFESVSGWIEITGFLLEITGKELYASELENIVNQSSNLFTMTELNQIEKLLVPWIFTKYVDHIHVNLFVNATIKYNHTLKGKVEITQETNFPESGKIQLKFKMENKRYIELFIRIPDWAEGATVTEKGVKYVAHPGEYCQITRKWSDGNLVEINFPIEKVPEYLRTAN